MVQRMDLRSAQLIQGVHRAAAAVNRNTDQHRYPVRPGTFNTLTHPRLEACSIQVTLTSKRLTIMNTRQVQSKSMSRRKKPTGARNP